MKLLLKRIDKVDSNSYKLDPGEHIIGRGALLQCASRKVSRNHGLLRIVPGDGAYLISTHINPCFHQACDTQHIRLVKQGFSMLLKNEDVIALLPNEYWYKVQIIKDVKDEKPPAMIESGSVIKNHKRELETDADAVIKRRKSSDDKSEAGSSSGVLDETIKSDSVLKNHKRELETGEDAVVKRRKSSDDKSEAAGSGGPCALNETIEVPSECIKKMEVIELDDDAEEDYGGSPCLLEENEAFDERKKDSEPIEIIDSEENNSPDALKDEDSGGNNMKEKDSDGINIKEEDSGGNNIKEEDSGWINIKEEDSGGNNIKEEIKDESIDLTPDYTNVENLPEDATEAKEFKKEKLLETTENDAPEEKVEETPDVPVEPVEETSEIKKDEVTSNLSDTTENDEHSKTNEKENCDNGEKNAVVDVNQPSTSGTLRRERCWYGSSCYRKNLQHKTDYSHSGDTDYNSDPNDSRPECAYGTACYRRNKLHRQQYKHTAQAIQPPPAQPNPPPNSPPKKRQRTKKGAGYESDADEDEFDYNDPFIDDGSSDEFQLSSTSDSSDDDDDDDESQEESQERKRMMKEAKKFMKRK